MPGCNPPFVCTVRVTLYLSLFAREKMRFFFLPSLPHWYLLLFQFSQCFLDWAQLVHRAVNDLEESRERDLGHLAIRARHKAVSQGYVHFFTHLVSRHTHREAFEGIWIMPWEFCFRVFGIESDRDTSLQRTLMVSMPIVSKGLFAASESFY